MEQEFTSYFLLAFGKNKSLPTDPFAFLSGSEMNVASPDHLFFFLFRLLDLIAELHGRGILLIENIFVTAPRYFFTCSEI